MDCANNSVFGDTSSGIRFASNIIECRLNQFLCARSIQVGHKSHGILCRPTELPSTVIEGISVKGGWQKSAVDESAVLERALDEG